VQYVGKNIDFSFIYVPKRQLTAVSLNEENWQGGLIGRKINDMFL